MDTFGRGWITVAGGLVMSPLSTTLIPRLHPPLEYTHPLQPLEGYSQVWVLPAPSVPLFRSVRSLENEAAFR